MASPPSPSCPSHRVPPRPAARAHSGVARRAWSGVSRPRWFLTLYVSILLTSFGLFTMFVFLVPFAESKGINPYAAASLLAVVGIFSTVGRLALGPIADRFGRLRTLQLAILGMAVSYPIWLAEPNYPGRAVFAAIIGAAYGGWVAISPSVLAGMFGTERTGGPDRALYTSAGIGQPCGPTRAGLVLDADGG